MNKENHIKELQKQIDNIKEAPVKHFIGKIGKAWKIDRLQKKILDLEKENKKRKTK